MAAKVEVSFVAVAPYYCQDKFGSIRRDCPFRRIRCRVVWNRRRVKGVLFPIDSAFKRRWDWEYVSIKDEEKGWYVKIDEKKYKWWSFLEKINGIVFDETQSADKQMGYFFVRLPEGQTEIDLKKFVNKVAFYLWNDVFKDCEIRENALKLKDANGQHGEPIKFTDFFKPHSAELNDKVAKDLFEGLGVEDMFKYINWGDVNHGMADEVKKDTVDLLNQLVPAWKIERGVRNAVEAVR